MLICKQHTTLDKKRCLVRFCVGQPAAQWFEVLAPALAWNEIGNQYITRFTDAKDKYRKRIEVESIKRQPEELIKSYIHRVTKAVEKGWPDPDFNNNQRTAKCMEYFVRGLTPPALKKKGTSVVNRRSNYNIATIKGPCSN